MEIKIIELKKPYVMINNIIDNFDFEKVNKVMIFLDWHWHWAEDGVPNISELKKLATRHLFNTVKDLEMNNDSDAQSTVHSGGIKVIGNKRDGKITDLTLEFIIEDWYDTNEIYENNKED